MAFLFSYGTLQREEVQMQLFGRCLYGEKDILKGYRLETIEITDIAFLAKGEDRLQKTLVVTKSDNDLIQGTALDLTGEELLIADKYEPENYKRIIVRLDSGKDAWVYSAIPAEHI